VERKPCIGLYTKSIHRVGLRGQYEFIDHYSCCAKH